MNQTENDTLAQRLTGDTPGAIETEKKAISLLPPGPSQLRCSLEESLAKYEAALKEAKSAVTTGGYRDAFAVE